MMAIFKHNEQFIRRLNWQFKFNSIHWLIVQLHLANDLKAYANFYLASFLSTKYFNRYLYHLFWDYAEFYHVSIFDSTWYILHEWRINGKKQIFRSQPSSWWLFDMWKLLYGSFFLLCSYFITVTITLFNIWFQLWLF